MSLFVASITIATDTLEHAAEIAVDRLSGVTEDYGFDYVLGDPIVTAAVPKLFEEYTEEELLAMPQEEFDALVGTELNDMSRDELRISMMRTLASLETPPPVEP